MSAALVGQDESVSTPGPREGGPRRRRAFTAREKLDHLAAYEAACATGDGVAGLSAGAGVVLLADHRVAPAPRYRDAAG